MGNNVDMADTVVLGRDEIGANLDEFTVLKLQLIATRVRKYVIEMTHEAKSGHPGGSLSASEILTVLYFHTMAHKPHDPKWEDRDRFILSKGHAAPALYATLAIAGYFNEEELMTLRKIGSKLQGHPSYGTLNGIEMATGSLGQGLSIGVGMALAAKLDNRKYTTFVMIGDGESQEGQIWEAAMAASHFKLNNLVGILDRNRLQIDGTTEEVMKLEPLAEKWKAFGWHVIETDGHNIPDIVNALERARKYDKGPVMVIAHTIKGKGVSFMENVLKYHGKPPTSEERERAIKELEALEAALMKRIEEIGGRV